MYVESQVCKEFLDHHYKKTAYQPNCSVPTVYLRVMGVGEKDWAVEKQNMGQKNKAENLGDIWGAGEHHLFTLV